MKEERSSWRKHIGEAISGGMKENSAAAQKRREKLSGRNAAGSQSTGFWRKQYPSVENG